MYGMYFRLFNHTHTHRHTHTRTHAHTHTHTHTHRHTHTRTHTHTTQLSKLVNEMYHCYNRHQYPFIALTIETPKGAHNHFLCVVCVYTRSVYNNNCKIAQKDLIRTCNDVKDDKTVACIALYLH